MGLEGDGVPSVAVHTHVFARLVASTARSHGMSSLRQVFVPQPVVGKSRGDLRADIEGADPVNKRPFMDVVLDGLSRPFDSTEETGVSYERSTPRLLEPDTEDNLQRLFHENGWTDGLPVILPTEERVAAMLEGTSHPADEVVGKLRPTSHREFWEFTVEKVAVNAVMAGARPEYFPVILALAASGMSARISSTTSFATFSVVNGPIRHEIGMNSGIGAMGPYSHANATIGRAHCLLSQNLQGGSVPGDTYLGSLGNWYAYTACFPENEERSPWDPFHVQQGFKPDDSTVSIFMGCFYTQSGFGPRDSWEDAFRHALAACEPIMSPVLILDPLVARGFVERGFDNKEKLIDWCARNALLPAREYWDNQWVQTFMKPEADAGVEPYAAYLKAAPDDLVQLFQPEDIQILVTGGETQPGWKMIGASYSGGRSLKITGSYRTESTVSVDAWR